MIINICPRSKYEIPGEENYLLVADDEKVALNPIFVERIKKLSQENPDWQFAARTPEVAAILIAARVPWCPRYSPMPR